MLFFALTFFQGFKAQTLPFKDNLKWGIKENNKILIKPVYDTIFNYENTGRVCFACYKTKCVSANKFIKTFTTVYTCNYLNKNSEKLKIKTADADTCSIFSLGKNTVNQFNDNPNYFVLSSKNKKYLVNKDFSQTIFKGYFEIYLSPEPNFIITEIKNEGGIIFNGLINFNEEIIVPYNYSNIKINSKDSLIVACSAGLGGSGEDHIFDYKGKKINSYFRHIDIATKNFVIHKIFEPREYYILLNVKSKEETIFNADEVMPFEKDKVLIRVKNDWFTFNLESKQRQPYKQ